MRELADYVSAQPGSNCAEALRGVGLPDRGRGYMRPLDRAIAAGLILAEPHRPGRVTRLFANERDRQLWMLRRELFSAPSPQRALQLVAEVEQILAGQALAYADAQEGPRRPVLRVIKGGRGQ